MIDQELIGIGDEERWKHALDRFMDFDIYHSHQYHLFAKEMGEGEPFLFLYQQNGEVAALPFLVRDVSKVKGLNGLGYYDATSVYGYPGVLTTIDRKFQFAENFRLQFQSSLRKIFEDLSVVAFFSRANPLIPTSWLFEGIGDVTNAGTTVAIDLSKLDADQLKDISKGHKYDIRKAKREGVIVIEDKGFQYLDNFINIYNETMNRVNSDNHYYFAKDYYINLKDKLGNSVKLYFAKLGDIFIGTSMFFCSNGIIQYHLSGTPLKYIKLSGAKVILDDIRQWGMRNGYKWLHLGGGLGSSEDHLYRFKAGFSKERFPFHVIKMIRDPIIYRELCERRDQWLSENNSECRDEDFFPYYRAPYQSFCVNG
jgi:hypothetical protein